MSTVENKIILPTIPREAVAVNPHVTLLYSVPKAGKTTITAALPNSLLVSLGDESADFVKANVIKAKNPMEFENICKEIITQGCKYDFVIYDSATVLDQWSETIGTLEYMNKPQGRRFNRNKVGEALPFNHPEFESVHTLGNGAGYAFSRAKMNDWYNLMSKTATHVILLAHVKDKYVETKNGDTVETMDISLTGKVKANYCVRADAVGHLHRTDGKAFINFDNGNSVVCGGRCSHLDGDILISEKQPDGSIKTFWDNIFIKQ